MVADVIFCDECRYLKHYCRCAKLKAPPTTEWRRAPNVVCSTCYFVSGAVVGALIALALVWFR